MKIEDLHAEPQVDSEFLFANLMPDRNLSLPVYRQMARKFRELVDAGKIRKGQSLPAERILAERLGISRTTVRNFFAELRSHQKLVSDGRSGAMVHSPPQVHTLLGSLKGFTEEMSEAGIEPSSQIIERGIVTDRMVASLMNRPSTAKFLKLVRLRLGNGSPMSRETAWYDLSLAPELEQWDASSSAYDFIRNVSDIRMSKAEQTVEAVMSSPAESRAFGFEKSAPCLLFKRKTYTASGQIVEYVEGVFRGDAYVYHLTLK